MSLYPTKTRLALLRAVAERNVIRDGQHDLDRSAEYRIVDARMGEMNRAGWVQLVDGSWSLTDTGRTVLAGGAP